jgi:hypothetical protein
VRCDSHVVTLFTTRFYGVSVEHDTIFSQIHPFQTCLSRTFPCLLLVQDLSLQEHATDAGPPVQEECSRGGQKEHGSHLDRGREKAASRADRS